MDFAQKILRNSFAKKRPPKRGGDFSALFRARPKRRIEMPFLCSDFNTFHDDEDEKRV